MTGHFLASSAFSLRKLSWPSGISSSEKIASTGHSGSHSVQSMHSSGSMTRKFGPSWKQSTGQTSTQSMYLHLMQLSVTTNAMTYPSLTLLMVKTILPQPRNPPAAADSPRDLQAVDRL